MKIFFFTGHIAGEPRKASITLLADNFAARGWAVRIVTLGYSWLNILKGDPRHAYAKTLAPNRWFTAAPNIEGYLCRTLLNASRLPFAWLNTLSQPFFRWYSGRVPEAVARDLRDADAIIIESGPGLLLVEEIKRINPRARLAYMVSDRLVTLGVHPVMMRAEKKYQSVFDLIIAPSALIAGDFEHPHVHFVPQGVDKKAFDEANVNPYATAKNVISVGDMLFHEQVVTTLARHNPDWTFHLFGNKARCKEPLPNIIAYGEKSFSQVVPYIKFADIGLAPYRPAAGVEYISQSSLKLKQYTYARLPILAPLFATGSYANIVAYDPHEPATLQPAFERAQAMDRTRISVAEIKSWPEVADIIIRALQ